MDELKNDAADRSLEPKRPHGFGSWVSKSSNHDFNTDNLGPCAIVAGAFN